ncbi:hypothetical protein B0H14DRAFT_2586897 [Mycena olivaceomarginata]|nr:hypothetical protein B0H14DRAFT_2586897 [Mycena olivaceomarginata]
MAGVVEGREGASAKVRSAASAEAHDQINHSHELVLLAHSITVSQCKPITPASFGESQTLFDTDGHFIGILWTAPTGETVHVPRTLNLLGHREKCQHQHRDHQVGEAYGMGLPGMPKKITKPPVPDLEQAAAIAWECGTAWDKSRVEYNWDGLRFPRI